MRRVVSSLATIIAGCLVIAFVFFQLKGFVGQIWAPWREVRQFAVVGADQRMLVIYFFPDWHVLFVYRDPSKGVAEASLAQVRGSMGTHYLWGLWHVEGPSVGLGYRWYPRDCQPFMMEIDTLKRHQIGKIDTPTFPDERERTYSEFVFCPETILFHNMELSAVAADQSNATALRRYLESRSIDSP